MVFLGGSKMDKFSDWVGVITVVVPPVQLVSSLQKLCFLVLPGGCGGGAWGTTNPSLSIVCSLFKQSSDSKRSVMDLSVVGVKIGLAFTEAVSLFSTMSKPRLLVSALFWTIFAYARICVGTRRKMFVV